MSGVKDRVSVKKNQHDEQIRLLLCTLKVLYVEFKNQNEDVNIGLYTFCILRPKWCVSSGGSGTHYVWVHDSSKCAFVPHCWKETYKELIDLEVCNTSNKQCMLQRCTDCPGISTVEMLLHNKFEVTDENITFKQ